MRRQDAFKKIRTMEKTREEKSKLDKLREAKKSGQSFPKKRK